MEISTKWVRKLRANARESGKCITCFQLIEQPARRTCLACNKASNERRRRRRAAARENQRSQVMRLHVLEAHEFAGDSAAGQQLYEAAGQHYKFALDVPNIDDNDRGRIEEKLMRALFLGPNPEAAESLMERILEHNAENPAKIVEILLQKCSLLWTKADSNEQAILERAVQIASDSGDPQLVQLMELAKGAFSQRTGDTGVSGEYFNTVGEISENVPPALRRQYHRLQALHFSRCGNAVEAYEHFELYLLAAKESNDPLVLIIAWIFFADWAMALGDTERMKTCAERALLTVRVNKLTWLVPYACVCYAHFLRAIGELEKARKYLSEALAVPAFAPVLETLFAAVGIPIALILQDETLLERCGRPQALDWAFRSGQDQTISAAAAAFAEKYAHEKRTREARRVVHRAMLVIRNADMHWDLLMAAARYGAEEDIRRGRELLEERTKLPSSEVSVAFSHLFDAFVARRYAKPARMRVHAAEAARRFDALQWHGYSDRARELLPNAFSLPESYRNIFSAGLHPHLTAREQEVAELVIEGHTNRSIAEKLAISEKTVETHLASIMSRLGVRSRYQLPDALAE